MKRFLSVLSVIAAAVSLTVLIGCIVTGIKRSGWVVTTAEITFVGLPNGLVFGTFKDSDGAVHSDTPLYVDGKFMPKGIIKGLPWVDPEPYYGRTVKIIYDPAAVNDDESKSVSSYSGNYDQWVIDIIVSGICIAISALVFVMLNKNKFRKRT